MAMSSMDQVFKEYVVGEFRDNREFLDKIFSDPDGALEKIRNFFRSRERKHFPNIVINMGHDAIVVLNALREEILVK